MKWKLKFNALKFSTTAGYAWSSGVLVSGGRKSYGDGHSQLYSINVETHLDEIGD